MKTAAVLLMSLVVLAGCEPEAAPVAEGEDLTEFMGTRAEREARAPYSPPGWPFQPGDLMTSREKHNRLDLRFGSWRGVSAPFWVGPSKQARG